jgi:hypothetical protein
MCETRQLAKAEGLKRVGLIGPAHGSLVQLKGLWTAPIKKR